MNKKIAVMMLSSMLLVGSLSNHVYAKEFNGEDINQIEQVKIDSKDNVDLEKQNEIEQLKEKNELLKLGIPSDIELNQWYPNAISKLPTKLKYKDKEKIDLSGMEIEFVKAIKTDKGIYEKVSENVSFEKLKETHKGWQFYLKTDIADLSKTVNGKMAIHFSFILSNIEKSKK